MENTSKFLMIAASMLLSIMIITMAIYLTSNLENTANVYKESLDATELQKYNSYFEVFVDRDDITPQEIMSLAGVAKQMGQNTRSIYRQSEHFGIYRRTETRIFGI